MTHIVCAPQLRARLGTAAHGRSPPALKKPWTLQPVSYTGVVFMYTICLQHAVCLAATDHRKEYVERINRKINKDEGDDGDSEDNGDTGDRGFPVQVKKSERAMRFNFEGKWREMDGW